MAAEEKTGMDRERIQRQESFNRLNKLSDIFEEFKEWVRYHHDGFDESDMDEIVKIDMFLLNISPLITNPFTDLPINLEAMTQQYRSKISALMTKYQYFKKISGQDA